MKPHQYSHGTQVPKCRHLETEGSFIDHKIMNVNTAWNEFGIRNGCDSILELKARLAAYNSNVTLSAIGCLILNDICFFDSPVAPATVGLIFPRQVVKLKYYNTPDPFLSHEAISYTGPFVLVNATDKTKNIHLMSERVGQPPPDCPKSAFGKSLRVLYYR